MTSKHKHSVLIWLANLEGSEGSAEFGAGGPAPAAMVERYDVASIDDATGTLGNWDALPSTRRCRS